MQRVTKFLLMWDMHGLEKLINVTAAEQEIIVSALKGEPIGWTNPLQGMLLRARLNSHRHYEIYLFESEMDEVSISDIFENDPQVIVDVIRHNGMKLYSSSVRDDQQVRIV